MSLVRHRPEDYVRYQMAFGRKTMTAKAPLAWITRSVCPATSGKGAIVLAYFLWSCSVTPHRIVHARASHSLPNRLGYEPVTAGFVFALMTALQMAGLFLGGVLAIASTNARLVLFACWVTLSAYSP